MLKTLIQILVRGAALFLALTLFFFLGNFLTSQAAKSYLSQASQNLGVITDNSRIALALRSMDLAALEIRNRDSVESRYQEAKSAQRQVNENLTAVEKTVPPLVMALLRPFRPSSWELLNTYNQNLSRSAQAYRAAKPMVDYYQASSRALYNFFYYDPGVAVALYGESQDYDILLQSFGRAQQGLSNTIKDLDSLAGYTDPTIKSFIPKLQEVLDQVDQVVNLSTRNAGQAFELAKNVNVQVRSLQEELLADRRKFWAANTDRQNLAQEIKQFRSTFEEEKISIDAKLAYFP